MSLKLNVILCMFIEYLFMLRKLKVFNILLAIVSHLLYCRLAVPHRCEWGTEGPSFPGARFAAVALPPSAHAQPLRQHASR